MTEHQLTCLAWAVETCAAMRGMLTGGPPETLEEFDRNIATARAALGQTPSAHAQSTCHTGLPAQCGPR